jgi:hypothetical protein
MSDDAPLSPYLYEGLDPVVEPKSTMSQFSDTVKQLSEAAKEAAGLVGDAIEAGRRPGRPLSVLSNIAREAPVASLLVAFVLGMAIGRRRGNNYRPPPLRSMG